VTRRLALLTLLGLVAACTDPFVPRRTPTYGFADQFGDVFHWSSDRLPVRFFADPRGNMSSLVADGVDAWEQQFLYGEFRGILVTDSTAADVIVVWADSVPPSASPDQGPAVVACGGVTQGVLDSTGLAFDAPFRTQISILTGTVYTAAQVQSCVSRVVIHELGHSLGVLREAPDTLAIMFATPRVRQPAAIDRRTVQVLYHTEATLAPAPP
jgi:predicted Zn-dependent protease